MNDHISSKQAQVLSALSESGMLLAGSGFAVEQRTIYGVCGDAADLAISLEWRDEAGCKWVADFSEESLASASVARNRIALKDSEGETVCVEFYNLKAGKI